MALIEAGYLLLEPDLPPRSQPLTSSSKYKQVYLDRSYFHKLPQLPWRLQ